MDRHYRCPLCLVPLLVDPLTDRLMQCPEPRLSVPPDDDDPDVFAV
jgi:hypothetical protein